MTQVTLRYVDGCPNWEQTDRRLRALQGEFGFSLGYEQVDTPEQAQRLGFAGSPTVLVNGMDPFATAGTPTGLACRVHPTPDGPRGSPSLEQLRDVLA